MHCPESETWCFGGICSLVYIRIIFVPRKRTQTNLDWCSTAGSTHLVVRLVKRVEMWTHFSNPWLLISKYQISACMSNNPVKHLSFDDGHVNLVLEIRTGAILWSFGMRCLEVVSDGHVAKVTKRTGDISHAVAALVLGRTSICPLVHHHYAVANLL